MEVRDILRKDTILEVLCVGVDMEYEYLGSWVAGKVFQFDIGKRSLDLTLISKWLKFFAASCRL